MNALIQMHPPVFALHQFHKSLNGTIVEIVSFLFSGRTTLDVLSYNFPNTIYCGSMLFSVGGLPLWIWENITCQALWGLFLCKKMEAWARELWFIQYAP